MRRHLFSVSLAAVGLFLLASDASACHNRKRACVCPPTPCATTVVVQPQPVKAIVKPVKHGHRLAGLRGRIGGLHKARQACAPAPCATVQQSVVYSSVVYSAPAPAPVPVDCATQACPTPQAPTKTVPVPPAKSAPVPPTKATPQEQG